MTDTIGTIGSAIDPKIREEMEKMANNTGVIEQAEKVAQAIQQDSENRGETPEQLAYRRLGIAQRAIESVFLSAEEKEDLQVRYKRAWSLYNEGDDRGSADLSREVYTFVGEIREMRLNETLARAKALHERVGEMLSPRAREDTQVILAWVNDQLLPAAKRRRLGPQDRRVTWKWVRETLPAIQDHLDNPRVAEETFRRKPKSQVTREQRAEKLAKLQAAWNEEREAPRAGQRTHYQPSGWNSQD